MNDHNTLLLKASMLSVALAMTTPAINTSANERHQQSHHRQPRHHHPLSYHHAAAAGFKYFRKRIQTGISSFYGAYFQGRRTANGERFNMYAMTCASTTIPMGTKIKVVNLHNHQQAICRVNDAGPYVGGRILDVSVAMARALKFNGLAQVAIYVH